MDLYDSSRSRHRKPTTTERFLGVSTHAPLHENPSSSRRTNGGGGDELSEDDVVFLSEDYTEPNHSSTPTSSASSTPRHHVHHNHKGFSPLDTFGILAALPENEPSPNARNGSHLFHKASVSSTSSSSSRSIPAIPKPPQDRIPLHTSSSSSSSVKYPQSAPVNVPVLTPAMMKARSRHREFDEDVDDEGDEGEEMLPPHEIVARNSAQSPMLAYSVLEGAGRTLKGRDLRQVRNAVWRQTGFLD
ncbi:Senescence regulator [Senna tora]|uniref:Senescence regulator n=1 Tax=Senna tora TaxID=362788 RepID=A0A834TLN1_9FABA|nr:Senescence regulator [Senna tora]